MTTLNFWRDVDPERFRLGIYVGAWCRQGTVYVGRRMYRWNLR